ncbi:FAD-dependent oxidoreductase [candidate division KSB1 bacterium]|nr:FAD-dependent oxidoreductase [candidate division KSB1 bacterium]
MMRLRNHPILEFKEQRVIHFTFDGQDITALEGDTIAAALHAAGIRTLSHSLRRHHPRGLFCAIGKCSSCLMEVDGCPNVKTCLVPVKDGMVVKSQDGWGRFPSATSRKDYQRKEIPTRETDIAIVGAGPAGLSAAIYAARLGARVMVMDENYLVGGQLIKQTHMFFGSKDHYAKTRGIDIGTLLRQQCDELAIEILTECSVIGYYHPHELAMVHKRKLNHVKAKAVIIATGASENMLTFPGNDLPGVYGAGAIQTLMNVYKVKPAERVLMVGAGNIGVIVSYQLLQAGVDVVAVVEATPKIGAYQVHASKLVRCGVPILTSHSIVKAYGNESVEGAVVAQLDNKWNIIPGTERDVAIDTICLSVGLNPASEILDQAGCRMLYIPELGGQVAVIDRNMETSVSGLYVAGDVSGIEEASSAMLEGRLAGVAAVQSLHGSSPQIEKLKHEIQSGLDALRTGPFGEKTRIGNKIMTEAAS